MLFTWIFKLYWNILAKTIHWAGWPIGDLEQGTICNGEWDFVRALLVFQAILRIAIGKACGVCCVLQLLLCTEEE